MFRGIRKLLGKDNNNSTGDVDNSLTPALAGMHITRNSREHPTSQPQAFVGGFDERYVQGNGRRTHVSGAALPPSFPQPQVQLKPLPIPPRVPLPESGVSRTMLYARRDESAHLTATQFQDSFRAPEVQVPPRPHSDPVVPQAGGSLLPPSSSRRASAGHVPLAAGSSTPTTRRKRRASSASSASSPAASATTLTTENKVQCSGVTKAGKRCTRRVKLGQVLTRVGQNSDSEIERFCFQHVDEVLSPSGFYITSKQTQTKTWIKYEDWIPDYLSKDTRAALRAVMVKDISKSDVSGYIYTFEIRDEETPAYIHMKVGRAVNIVKRIDEWSKQCGSKEQVLRGYWPSGLEDDDGPMMRGRVQAGPPGPWCHRMERLVHLELADLSVYAQYLHAKFPLAESCGSEKFHDKIKEKCPDCNRFHQEIFTFIRPEDGLYAGKEWEKLVKPVIEKWGAFIDGYF